MCNCFIRCSGRRTSCLKLSSTVFTPGVIILCIFLLSLVNPQLRNWLQTLLFNGPGTEIRTNPWVALCNRYTTFHYIELSVFFFRSFESVWIQFYFLLIRSLYVSDLYVGRQHLWVTGWRFIRQYLITIARIIWKNVVNHNKSRYHKLKLD